MPSTVPAAARERPRALVVTVDKEAEAAMAAELSAVAELSLLPDLDDLTEAVASLSPALLIFDLDSIAEKADASQAVEAARARFPVLPVLALTRSRSAARQARALGVRTLLAPVHPDELIHTVESILRGEAPESMAPAISDRQSLGELVGASEPMQRVYEAILRLADSNTTVLIRGESGSGKELAARAIVAHGRRRTNPFISLNCAALPESLIESELFGHERGAYTGADHARPGQIELAHTGTLFLDEIATLTLPLQTKLLRVLEDREVRRIGGNTGRSIDFRLITATNEDLETMVSQGRFREDLYYRINVVPLDMPALREREGDIPLLVDHYMRRLCASEGKKPLRFEPEAMEMLEEYNWPGNVRELENLMQRLVLMAPGPTIAPQHLPKNVLYASTAHHESLLIPEEGLDFAKEMDRIEAAYLRAALRRVDGSRKDAGKLLNLTPRQMKYLCQKHGL